MLTVQEVADKLKVSENTVYRWIYSGKLQAVKIEGIIRIPESEYLRFTTNPVKSFSD